MPPPPTSPRRGLRALYPPPAALFRRHFSVAQLPPLSLLPPCPSLHQIRQAHALLVALGLSSSRAALGHLLAACAASPSPSPSLAYSRAVLGQIDVPNVFACNNFIRCLARSAAGDAAPGEALTFYGRMRRGSIPTNNYTFPFLLQACSKGSAVVYGGAQVHAHVVKLGHAGDVFVRNGLVHFYCECRCVGDARKMFDELPDRRDVVTWNAIIAGYARDEQVEVCEELFATMPERDAISWSTMIMGYVQGGLLEKGLGLFREMVERGVAVNEATYVSVLSASAQLGLLEHGQFIHSAIKAVKFPMTITVATALVDMYAKCGCIALSKQEALQLFERFMEEGLCPTSVTFVGVLNACSRAGLVNDGRRHFDSMTRVHGIQPEMEHYGCMVDLFARSGLVAEALEFVEGMRVPPDPVLWGTLLGACKTHGLVDLGVTIGNKLIELEPSHDGHYVLLAGVYAKARNWHNVAKVRQLMSSRGTSKSAGWSLIEAGGRVHKFTAGDREHERSTEIYQTLETIGQRLAEAGYSPDVSCVLHDIGEEEKVHVMKEHSERLAIAFGLMVIEAGHPIRVVKNLRVCGDCHEVSKMISKVFEREIIVRDGSRFHHFKEGSCSCLDYW
ncbi:hypothetical protein Taro_020489 [Colocasia esculenta]|uniref:DYW domain-containing protein n=1 Tax=Colocasia esculenta TaxID=4460 RepID=A0A843UWI8_COLES|nr:hypothetical protein [Colocasia esculenta]